MRHPVLRVNNIYGMFRAAASGLGIASLPDYMGQLAHDHVPIMPELEGLNSTFISYIRRTALFKAYSGFPRFFTT